MADYRKIITDAKKAVTETVHSVNMSSIKDVYVRGTERAKSFARIAKLNMELGSDYDEMRKVYAEIGRLYYEEACAQPEGVYAPLFANVEQLRETVKAKEQEIADLKASVESDASTEEAPDFDDVVSRTEDDGTKV